MPVALPEKYWEEMIRVWQIGRRGHTGRKYGDL